MKSQRGKGIWIAVREELLKLDKDTVYSKDELFDNVRKGRLVTLSGFENYFFLLRKAGYIVNAEDTRVCNKFIIVKDIPESLTTYSILETSEQELDIVKVDKLVNRANKAYKDTCDYCNSICKEIKKYINWSTDISVDYYKDNLIILINGNRCLISKFLSFTKNKTSITELEYLDICFHY